MEEEGGVCAILLCEPRRWRILLKHPNRSKVARHEGSNPKITAIRRARPQGGFKFL